jgi:Domain of unknown function (DUF4020)
VLEHLLAHDHPAGVTVIARWIASDSLLLRRLAIHGMSQDVQLAANEKLQWIREHGLLRQHGIKHELFRLLAVAYPHSSDPTRRRLFAQACEQVLRPRVGASDDERKTQQYELYNLAVWLDQICEGQCPIAARHLKALQRRNKSFRPREYPDFDVWHSGVVEVVDTPVSAEALLRQPPADLLQFLRTYVPSEADPFGPTREGLLRELGQAISIDPNQGTELSRLLIAEGDLQSDLWPSVVTGFARAKLTEPQWSYIFQVFTDHPELIRRENELVELLSRGIDQKDTPIPSGLLGTAESLGDKIWRLVAAHREVGPSESENWLQSAINQDGGKLTMFFLKVLSLERKAAGPRWSGLPTAFRARLDEIVSGPSYSAEMGRVVLASQLHFIFAADASWTRSKVIPLLDLDRYKRRGTQAWHGYLSWGRWNSDMLPDLLPRYRQAFSHLDSHLSSVAERLVQHVATICLFASDDAVRGDWLIAFLRTAGILHRKTFARSIRQQLSTLDPVKAEATWKNWLLEYVNARLLGKPVALSAEELSEMIHWAICVGAAFPEAVKLLTAGPSGIRVDFMLLHELKEAHVAEKYPPATAMLLRFILGGLADGSYLGNDLVDVVESLVPHRETHGDLKIVLDRMAILGYSRATELGRQIEVG